MDQDVGKESSFDNSSLWEAEFDKKKLVEGKTQKDIKSSKKESSSSSSKKATSTKTKLFGRKDKDKEPSSASVANIQASLQTSPLNNSNSSIRTSATDNTGSSSSSKPSGHTKLANSGSVNPNIAITEAGVYSWKSFDKIGSGSTIPPEIIGKWIIAEPSINFCEVLWKYFYDVKSVKIINKSFNELVTSPNSPNSPTSSSSQSPVLKIDALILAGNVYGFREATKMWKEVANFFGEDFISKIRSEIQERYMGEAPLFTSFVLETNNAAIKYVVYTASYLSSVANVNNAYSSLWSALLAIKNHNKLVNNSLSKINTFVSKGFLNIHQGDEESARQMFLAFHNTLSPPSYQSDSYIDAKDATLSDIVGGNNSSNSGSEEARFLMDMCLSGDLEKRDFISNQTVEFLIDIALAATTSTTSSSPANSTSSSISSSSSTSSNNSNSSSLSSASSMQDSTPSFNLNPLQLAAAKTVARYAFPHEFIHGIVDTILNKGGLHLLCDLVMRDLIKTHLEIDIQHMKFSPNTLIAEGGSGKVYKGIYRGMEVAVKEMSDNMLNFNITEYKREIAIMSMLKNEYLVPFIGAASMKNKEVNTLYIITKFIKGGNLRDLLQSPADLPLKIRMKMSADIAKGMNFLHQKNIIHRDLKSLNILIDDGYAIRITDFGTSRIVDTKNSMTTVGVGTVAWMAPEIFNNEKYTEKADIYSFGIVLWEMVARKTPFQDLQSWNIPVVVTKGERPVIPKETPEAFARIIKACWQQRPKQRPSFAELEKDLQSLYEEIGLSNSANNVPTI